MKVVEYTRFGDESVLEVVDRPTPTPGAGQVLVNVHAAALNPKDVLTRSGRMARFSGTKFPRRQGYDWSGVVASVGPGVTSFAVGDELFGMVQAWSAGALAEQLVVQVGECARRPMNLSHVECAAMPLAALTALQALRDEGQLKAGQRVLVNGASGGVGTWAVQLARVLGAHVTAVTSERNAELVRGLGANTVVDYAHTKVTSLEGPYDVFFDVFGNTRYAAVKRQLSARGRWVSTVPKPHVVLSSLLSTFTSKKARLVVVRSRERDLQQLASWATDGVLKPVIEQVFPLSEVAEANRRIATKRTRGKIVITTR